MSDSGLLERPPTVLPPRGEGDRRPRREWIIMPDIRHCEIRTKTQHNNCWTIHYVWMNKFHGMFEDLQIAHVNSRRYRQWLDTYDMPDGIPPHIQFGGAVVSGTGDPKFHSRWVEYVQRTFC